MKKLINVLIVVCVSVLLSNCSKDDPTPPVPKQEFIFGKTAGAAIPVIQAGMMDTMIHVLTADPAKLAFNGTNKWIGIYKSSSYTPAKGNTGETGEFVEGHEYLLELAFDSIGFDKVMEAIVMEKSIADMFEKVNKIILADTAIHLPLANVSDSILNAIKTMYGQVIVGRLVLSHAYLQNFVKIIDKNYAYIYLYYYSFVTPDSKKKLSGPGVSASPYAEALKWLKVNHPEVYIPSE